MGFYEQMLVIARRCSVRTRSIRMAGIIGVLLFHIGVLAQSTESQENVIGIDIDGLRSDR